MVNHPTQQHPPLRLQSLPVVPPPLPSRRNIPLWPRMIVAIFGCGYTAMSFQWRQELRPIVTPSTTTTTTHPPPHHVPVAAVVVPHNVDVVVNDNTASHDDIDGDHADPPTVFLFDPRLSDDDSTHHRLCQQRADSLVWTVNGTYDDLLEGCDRAGSPVSAASIIPQEQQQQQQQQRLVVLWHAIPKTAGTTVRKSIFRAVEATCATQITALPQRQFGPAFQKADDLEHLLNSCTDQRTFALGSPYEFQHQLNDIYVNILPFRPFYEWSRSAMNQIVKWHHMEVSKQQGNGTSISSNDPNVTANAASDATICTQMTDSLRSQCQGLRELQYRSYTKPTLERLLGTPQRRSQSYVVLYNFRDTSTVFDTLLAQMWGLPRTVLKDDNDFHYDGTCDPSVLSAFHDCYDDRLVARSTFAS